MRSGSVSGSSPQAHLGDLDVSDAEHQLEDAIAAGDDGGLGHEYGPGPLLGVADAREQDADGQGVQQQPEHALSHQHRRGPRTVVGAAVAVPCATQSAARRTGRRGLPRQELPGCTRSLALAACRRLCTPWTRTEVMTGQ